MVDLELFPFSADTGDKLVETHGFKTNILDFENDLEQRVQLRGVPLETIEFSVLTARALIPGRGQALLDAFILRHQAEVIAVPAWQFSSYLTAITTVGGQTFLADVRWCPYIVGGLVAVWADAFTWELFTVDTIADDQITIVETATREWAAGSIIVPVRAGRLPDAVELERVVRSDSRTRILFTMEATATAAAAIPTTGLPSYQGIDVLEITDQREASRDRIGRRIYTVESGTGARVVEPTGASGTIDRALVWLCDSREEAALMRTFIDARRGMAIPFWLISREDDLQLAADVTAGTDTMTILASGYSELVDVEARRYLAMRVPGNPWFFRAVIGAVDNLDGTETLTLDAGVPYDLFLAEAMVCFLRHVRLATDEPKITWFTGHVAEAELPLRELPLEAPALP